MPTKIEWVKNPDGTQGETWNPLAGCTRVSAGCKHCYAERMAKRQIAMGNKNYAGTVDKHGRWTGKINLIQDALDKPLRWRKPRRIFVNSMSDLFHENVPFEYIDQVFAVMALCPQHTFQVLTKRPERMVEYFDGLSTRIEEVYPNQEMEEEEFLITQAISNEIYECSSELKNAGLEWLDIWNARAQGWPLPNVQLWVSVEDQGTADERIPWLLKTPAAVRGVSYEPALGPVDFTQYGWLHGCDACCTRNRCPGPPDCTRYYRPECPVCKGNAEGNGHNIDGIIVGGESGPGARPMHPDWVQSVRDQCQEAGVAFFFKQWGAWVPACALSADSKIAQWNCLGNGLCVYRVGKKAAGRILDGRTWDELPGEAMT